MEQGEEDAVSLFAGTMATLDHNDGRMEHGVQAVSWLDCSIG